MIKHFFIICTLVSLLFHLVGCGSCDTSSTIGAPPTIASILPMSAPAGTTVTITGSNFSTTPTNNSVTFNGVAAIVTNCTSSQIITTVPSGATAGPIALTVAGIHVTSSSNFFVLTGGSVQGLLTSPTGVVSTLAGIIKTMGSTDGVGTTASFKNPLGITTDGTNLYVADQGNRMIRKIVIATGAVGTLAGTAGIAGSADGIGAAASFYMPWGITTDGTNLYVTDSNNVVVNSSIITTSSTIRKIVIATGAVSTLAGTADTAGSADGRGAAASFTNPLGITTDGTNLYVADSKNNTIRKIVISTGVVSTIAGSPIPAPSGSDDGIGSAASFDGPAGITTDGTALYVVDRGNNTIRKVVIATGAVTTMAGSPLPTPAGSADGIGSAARFFSPLGITTDGASIYVADNSNNTIRKIVIATGAVSTMVGTAGTAGSADGTGTAASFNHPVGITTDGTNIYVADAQNETIRKIR